MSWVDYIHQGYLVGDARISQLCLVLGNVEEVLLGRVLPELCRTFGGELANAATKFATASRPSLIGDSGKKINVVT